MTPTYAVLFKCHQWQGFEQRQLDRLRQRVASGDIFVLIDRDKATVGAIDHPAEQTLRIGLADATDIGLLHNHNSPVFWYSNDYPLHIFSQKFPRYEYYVMIEYDVVPNVDFDDVLGRLSSEAVDFVGEPIRTPLADWPWRGSCDGWYPPEQIRHWLSCLAVFSNRAAHHLYSRRVAACQRLSAGEFAALPMCEAVIPTELRLAGFRMKKLGEFGPVTHFCTAPHFPEERLPDFAGDAFIHPVLDRHRFLEKVLTAQGNPEVLLDRHPYRAIMTDQIFAAALPRIHHMLWSRRNDAGCVRVIDAMREINDPAYLHLHGLDGNNLALGMPTTQSSRSEWSLRPDEASGAVTGPVSGRYKFHTKREVRPWWMVDLLTRHPIRAVRVFNRMDIPFRSNGLEVFVSADGRLWDLAGRHHGDAPFGGADGRPLDVAVNAEARFIRLELPGTGILHLDQVQVIGEA